MEKKMLEVLIDENGKIRFSSEFNPLEGIKENNPSNSQKYLSIVDEMVESLFTICRKDTSIRQIIKALSIADISSDVQPYECIEHLWSTMMFDFLPEEKKKYRRFKEKHGVKVKVVEPISYRDPFMFPVGPES